MEKYAINISNTWSIEYIKNIDKEVKLESIDFESPFAQLEISESKINWILDHIKPSDDVIKMCNKIELFNHEVEFDIYLLVKSEWEKKYSFEGNFVDALIYIQKEFSNE